MPRAWRDPGCLVAAYAKAWAVYDEGRTRIIEPRVWPFVSCGMVVVVFPDGLFAERPRR